MTPTPKADEGSVFASPRSTVSMSMAALAAFLLAPAAFAQSADLAIRLAGVPARLAAGEVYTYTIQFENNGPDAAQDVAIEVTVPGSMQAVSAPQGLTCTMGTPVRCKAASWPATQHAVTFYVQTRLPGEESVGHANAAIGSETFDPSYTNNFSHVPSNLVVAPDLAVAAFTFQPRVDPSARARFIIDVHNRANATAAENARLTATLPDGGTVIGYRGFFGRTDCTFSGSSITCELGTVGPNQDRRVEVEYEAPARLTGGEVRLVAEVTAGNGEFDPEGNRYVATADLYRWLVVDNTNDDGAGSLRQALIDTAGCGGDVCKVAFRIPAPVPASGWFTIRPRSPLPPAHGDTTIDGATQTALTGDTNAEGPEIEIHGALAGPASGLTLAGGCNLFVNALAINGFDGHGIDVKTSGRCTPQGPFSFAGITANSIGGNRRGIVVSTDGRANIVENVISGNTRAGVFVWRAHHTSVLRNRIDGNGGSGVYVDDTPADVDENTIARNGEWGIARIAASAEVGMRRNAIFENAHMGIDIGLDFETTTDGSSFPNAPELLSAIYDPATNTTTVRGRYTDEGRGLGRYVELFASRGPNRGGRVEGERFVGATSVSFDRTRDFTVEVKEDLTGQFLTATHTRRRYTGFARPLTHPELLPNTTSEFSSPIQVPR